MTDQERAAVPGIEKGREKSIHLGAIILERFLYTLRTIDCRVSVRGWRYALLDYDRAGRRVE
jgi:exopolyphosphatase / guanosine-5'-triphosphate,3'-diphosphate pyrophosphatase